MGEKRNGVEGMRRSKGGIVREDKDMEFPGSPITSVGNKMLGGWYNEI